MINTRAPDGANNIWSHSSCQFPETLAVLGFPCNQFGDQENCENDEIMKALEHVRPGGGFKPLATMFQKVKIEMLANIHKYNI